MPVTNLKSVKLKFYMRSYLLLFLIFASMALSGCKDKVPENEINASGTIEATDVTVSSKIAGQIRNILVDEGSIIKKDDILVVLDHELLDIQLRQAAAGVDIAQAQLDLLISGARKEDITLAQDQVESAKITLDQATADKERFIKLYETNTITLKQLEDVTTKYDIAFNQYKSAEENLNKIKNITRKEDIESAKANVQKNKVSMELIQQNIDDCTIKSPVTGIVSKKFSETGEYVTPGSSILKIADLKTVNLYIYITEPELGKVKLGQSADVTIDSYKDKVYKGEIIYISQEAEFTPKSIQTKEERTKLVYAVKIKIPNPDMDLKSGMPADAKLIIN